MPFVFKNEKTVYMFSSMFVIVHVLKGVNTFCNILMALISFGFVIIFSFYWTVDSVNISINLVNVRSCVTNWGSNINVWQYDEKLTSVQYAKFASNYFNSAKSISP